MMKTLQKLGKSLMLPVAVLPAAAILMGVGYWIDPAGWGGESALASFLVTAGAAILDNIPLLFAVGVAFGMAREQSGAAALSGLVGFMVITTMLTPGSVGNLLRRELSQIQEMAFDHIGNVFVGIISGCVAASAYSRFYKTELPAAMSFFSGRRLVPIVTAVAMLIVSFIFLIIWPPIYYGLLAFGEAISGLGAFGAALYGFFNRLLIPVGLHHTLNAVFWFDFIGINDLHNFWRGTGVVGQTGMYMGGFFPVMMFGLPGACMAMYRCAKDKNKKAVFGLLSAAAFASFFTGVTEPVEFSFMFVAPLLYVVHALLTAVSMFITASFQWFAGFAFSAGFIDLFLSTRVEYSTNWYMLIPLGIVYFFVYFFLFSLLIRKFNLHTPGREEDDIEAEMTAVLASDNYTAVAADILDGLGGKDNISELDYCATRLRIEVINYEQVNEKKIKAAGVSGVIRPSKTSVQVIIGTKVQFVMDEMKKLI